MEKAFRNPSRLAGGALVATAAAALVACGGGGSSSNEQAMGSLRVALTDAPCHVQYDNVFVTVEKVRVHQSSTAAETDGGWSEVVLATPQRIDLLTLTNGALRTLGQTELPAGAYTQARLVLAANGGGTPLANAVKPAGGSEVALDTPSGQQSGLKINVNVTVPEGQVADLVIDFDVCKSVVKAGASGKYLLKPVLSATTVLSSAGQRIEGYVVPALGNANTVVSLQLNGEPVKATPPDTGGKFVLSPVAPGTYDLVITAAGRVSAVLTGVPVAASAPTIANAASAPIDLPQSTLQRQVSGVARIAGSTTVPEATAQLKQALAATAPAVTIEVAAQPVDASSGAYGFTVPAEAPLRAAYSASAPAITFAADAAAAGKYTLIGKAPGRTTQTHAVDVSAGNVTQDIVFP
jgi:hypothetical protein